MRHNVPERPGWLIAPVAAVIITAVALAVASLALPRQTDPGSSESPAQARITRVCPALGASTTVGFATSGSGLVRAPLAGSGQQTELSATGIFTQENSPTRVSGPVGTPFWGLVLASAPSGVEGGLSLAPCLQARSQHWFTGVRSNAGAQSELVLVNLDGSEAAVNVRVYGSSGQLPAAGGRGVIVGPFSQRILGLAPVVTSDTPVTLEVSTSSGRVAAIVRQRLFDGVNPKGGDWIEPAAAPALVTTVPAVAAGEGARVLVVGNPTDRTAQVTVDVLGADGAYSPVGAEQVDVPAESTRSFNLEGAVRGTAVAVRLRSTRDVVAAVEARGATDWTTVSSAEPLGLSAVATVPSSAGTLSVIVSNPSDKPAHVELKATSAAGAAVAAKTAEVAPGASLVVTAPTTDATTLSVTSDVPDLRVGLVQASAVGPIAGIAGVTLEGEAASLPSVVVVNDPRLGG